MSVHSSPILKMRGGATKMRRLPIARLPIADCANSVDRLAILLRVLEFAIERLDAALSARLRVARGCGRGRSTAECRVRGVAAVQSAIGSQVGNAGNPTSVHRFGWRAGAPTPLTASRRSRFSSLTGSMTSPSRKFFELAQFERRAAEPPKLFAQTLGGQRLLLRLRQRHRRIDTAPHGRVHRGR